MSTATRTRWVSYAAMLLAGATACGGKKSADDADDSQAGQSGSPGSGGASASGGTSGGSGGAAGGQGGTSGSATGGSSAGGTGGTTGGSGGTLGGAAGAGGSGGNMAGTAGMGGVGGSSGGAGPAPGFTEGAELAPGVSVVGDPKLAVNRAGVALVAWPGYVDTRVGIWTIRYDPATKSWGEPFAIHTDSTYDAELDDLALDELGNAYVAWKQGFIFVTRYDASGAAWADGVQIEQHSAGGIGDARLAAGPSGTASILWPESDGSRTSQRHRLYDPKSDEWSYWEAIDDRDYRDSGTGALAVDPLGNALAAWQQSGDSGVKGGLLLSNRFDAQSSSWDTAEVLVPETGVTSPFAMAVAADRDGNFFLVWEQAPTDLGGDTEVWARRYAAGGGWDDAVRLEDQVTFATTEPHVALDDDGNAMVVWTADDHLWGTRYDVAAGSWSEATQIDDTAGWVAKWASVAVDPDGNALAVSSQWPTKDITLDVDAVASRYDAATGTWGPGGLLEHHDDSAFAPSVGIDGQGKGFVVWYREKAGDLWLSTYEPG